MESLNFNKAHIMSTCFSTHNLMSVLKPATSQRPPHYVLNDATVWYRLSAHHTQTTGVLVTVCSMWVCPTYHSVVWLLHKMTAHWRDYHCDFNDSQEYNVKHAVLYQRAAAGVTLWGRYSVKAARWHCAHAHVSFCHYMTLTQLLECETDEKAYTF